MLETTLAIAMLVGLEPPANPPAPAKTGVCDVAVHSGVLSPEAFIAAAGLRLPGVRLREAGAEADPACRGRLHAHVELRAIDEQGWELSLILSDGRAWYRTLDLEEDQAARGLASALANLLAGISDEALDPDAEDVGVPEALREGGPAPELVPEPVPEPPPEAADPLAPAPARPVLFELGPRLGVLASVGLAPGPGLRGFGGEVGLDLRLPDGLAFTAELRTLGRSAAGLTMVRSRVSFGVGVDSRWDRFSLTTLFFALVEPWVVREAGRRVDLGAPPLIGGGVRLAPSHLVPIGPVTLRVGAVVGLEIAVEAAPGALTAGVALDPGSDPVLRAGGVELDVGLELGVWIPVRKRK